MAAAKASRLLLEPSLRSRRCIQTAHPLLQLALQGPASGIREIGARAGGSTLFALPGDFNVMEGVEEAVRQQRINRYFPRGFTVGGRDIQGSIITFGSLLLRWKVTTFADVTPGSLAVFGLLRPAPEILVLGTGAHGAMVDPAIRSFLREQGILLEAVATANAVSTYNVLIEDGRSAAAALVTQEPFVQES